MTIKLRKETIFYRDPLCLSTLTKHQFMGTKLFANYRTRHLPVVKQHMALNTGKQYSTPSSPNKLNRNSKRFILFSVLPI